MKIMSNTETVSIMQRVRHEFRSRHVQLLAREQLSPGFIRLTVGGPELAGFVSAGFDDHTKLILPQAGMDRPNLPQMVDGRPHIAGERPTMRDYTPLNYDAARHTLPKDHGSNLRLSRWLDNGALRRPRGPARRLTSMVTTCSRGVLQPTDTRMP